MGHRTKSKDRCPRCRINRVLCLCPVIPHIETSTKLIVLIHYRETKRPTNTGHIATLALPHSELRVRGLIGQPMSTEGLVTPERQSLLLYPSYDATELSPEYIASFKRPITLIVPDGSWRQASKVGHRISELDGIPRVTLPFGAPTAYKLRREIKYHGLSTFEAIARALGIIENPQVQSRLEELFKIMVDRTLWSRGKLLAEDCESPLPVEALQKYYRDQAGKKASRHFAP